jgi:hypothetical protein
MLHPHKCISSVTCVSDVNAIWRMFQRSFDGGCNALFSFTSVCNALAELDVSLSRSLPQLLALLKMLRMVPSSFPPTPCPTSPPSPHPLPPLPRFHSIAIRRFALCSTPCSKKTGAAAEISTRCAVARSSRASNLFHAAAAA